MYNDSCESYESSVETELNDSEETGSEIHISEEQINAAFEIPEESSHSKSVDVQKTEFSQKQETNETIDKSADYDLSSEKEDERSIDEKAFEEFPAAQTEAEKEISYDRPTSFRAGVRDEVWKNAQDAHNRVRDPGSGRYMSKDQPWDMGHKPGYEFVKHQESARMRGISREQFLDEHNNPDHYRPELPSSNRSHKCEEKTANYYS